MKAIWKTVLSIGCTIAIVFWILFFQSQKYFQYNTILSNQDTNIKSGETERETNDQELEEKGNQNATYMIVATSASLITLLAIGAIAGAKRDKTQSDER